MSFIEANQKSVTFWQFVKSTYDCGEKLTLTFPPVWKSNFKSVIKHTYKSDLCDSGKNFLSTLAIFLHDFNETNRVVEVNKSNFVSTHYQVISVASSFRNQREVP